MRWITHAVHSFHVQLLDQTAAQVAELIKAVPAVVAAHAAVALGEKREEMGGYVRLVSCKHKLGFIATGEFQIHTLTDSSEGQSADGKVDQAVVSQQSSAGCLSYHPFDQLFVRASQSNTAV